MPPIKPPISAPYIDDGSEDDSSGEYFPDEYGQVQVLDELDVCHGAKKVKVNIAENPEDNNPVTSLFMDVSEARIGYFKLSDKHLKHWRRATTELNLIAPNDKQAHTQKHAHIQELEEDMEEHSSWLAVAYDINKMTPEIELFLSTNVHHYQESDTEQDRLHMALEYVFEKPKDTHSDIIHQAKNPGGWPIPYPMQS
ncbi:hypothetical protein CPB84DRAFT_1744119 [Gymnopilus junonius]|uniref:Uncharacterized protein n=1 Tax=Gymnopilus junonius TaxID=109634 RepID=A0A9P5NU03_GYMJU|nr:hypothetical protein CPB84DRAFT_1744119 [Gymnopilus junonius]